MSEGQRISKCLQHWEYADIYKKEFHITVLSYYSRRVYGSTSTANFLIGVTESGDTLGFLDKYYAAPLEKNDRVLIVDGDWGNDEKEDRIFQSSNFYYISSFPEKNDFLCSVNIVLRGRILFKLDN